MPESKTEVTPTETKSTSEKLYPEHNPKETKVDAPKDAKTDEVPPVKVEGEKPKETPKPEGDPPAVPAKYELKIPKDSPLNEAQVAEVTSYAKEKGLTNDQAQSVLDRDSAVVAGILKEQATKFDAEVEGWKTAVHTDSELGGKHLNESVLLSKTVLEKFGSKALRDELNATGFGNHPELMRLLVRIGKASEAAKLVQPNAPQVPVKISRADKFYGADAAKS